MKAYILLVSLSSGFLTCVPTHAAAPATAFTYQGTLIDQSRPVTGLYDFQFTLYDTVANGVPLGRTDRPRVAVSNGLFSVRLDFGTNLFNGNARFLSIGVRPNAATNVAALQAGNPGQFTVLMPRQEITATPYTAYAVTAGQVSDGAIGSAEIVNGSIQDADISSSAAIGIQKISGDAGIDFLTWTSTEYTRIPSGDSVPKVMGSVNLTAPTSGYVVVTLSGGIIFFNNQKLVIVGINASSNSIPYASSVTIGRLDGVSSLRFREAFSVVAVFPVSAGSQTFRAEAMGVEVASLNQGTATVEPRTMVAQFFPKRY